MNLKSAILTFLSILFLLPFVSKAALITDSSSIPSPNLLIDFEQFGPGSTKTNGPVQIGDVIGENVIWSTTTAFGPSVIGSVDYGLGVNGYWRVPKTFVGLNSSPGTMLFEFIDLTVSAVGGFINYAPGADFDVLLEALDVNGNVLESYNINQLAPISTPGATNQGAFRGILR